MQVFLKLFSVNFEEVLTVAEKKREWLDGHLAALRARGMNDTEIARQMGITRSYLYQVVGGPNIGDTFIDRMCSAFVRDAGVKAAKRKAPKV